MAVHTLTARRTWLTPVLLILGLAAALPAIYLTSTADPQGHLSGLPVALVVEDQPSPASSAKADAVAAAIEAHASEQLAITRVSRDDLDAAMSEDRVAGAVVVPADFGPSVSVLVNAGDGGLSGALLAANVTPLLQGISRDLGPFEVTSGPYEPLPDHAGFGMSAFYYALVLVLLGFIGASLVGPLVDSALGFLPSELGPLVERRPYTAVSRRTTFLAKAEMLAGTAPFAALVLQLVAGLAGVSVDSPVTLWAYSTAVIAAIGTSALAVLAIFGPGVGSLVNTLFFVAASMVSSGGTVPLEATPRAFDWFSAIAPFRHVVDGTRALFYFDGNLSAGLGSAWITVLAGGLAGLALGALVTSAYARVPAFSRHPR